MNSKTSTFLDLITGAVLIYSAMIHFANPYFLLESTLNYQLVDGFVAESVAILVIHGSFLCGLCLLTSQMPSCARWFAVGLFVAFVVAQTFAVSIGNEIGCGCFGDESEKVGIWTILRTLVFLGFVLLSIYFNSATKGESCEAAESVTTSFS
jgi:hypothetical protein